MRHLTLAQLIITLLSLTVVGCGGGGGGDAEAGSSGTSSSSPSLPPSSNQQPVTLAQLNIDADNNLSSTYQINIDVMLPQLSAEQAYIAVCDTPQSGANINYDQCLVKAALQAGRGQFSLTVPNHIDTLTAVISVMAPYADPLFYAFNFESQALSTWLIQ